MGSCSTTELSSITLTKPIWIHQLISGGYPNDTDSPHSWWKSMVNLSWLPALGQVALLVPSFSSFTHTHNNMQLPCPSLCSLHIKMLLLSSKNKTLSQSHISRITLILSVFKGKFAHTDHQADQTLPQTPPLPPFLHPHCSFSGH